MSRRLDHFDRHVRGLGIIQRQSVSGNRGYLERLFCAQELRRPFALSACDVAHRLLHDESAGLAI